MDNNDMRAAELALGRLFRLMSRPTQPGDVQQYEKCRAVLLEVLPQVAPEYRPSWVRDRRSGAQGD